MVNASCPIRARVDRMNWRNSGCGASYYRPRTPLAVRSSMPNSSASISVSTSAAQLIATNGPSRRTLKS
jgi:hypothetical protein